MRFKLIRREDVDFREGIMPILQANSDYLAAITDYLFQGSEKELAAQEKKYRLEKVLQTEEATFPEWVYGERFNPTLREGHRHFLIRTEQLSQILYAMHYVARKEMASALLTEFHAPINACVAEIQRVIIAIISRLALKETGPIECGLSEKNIALEEVFYRTINLPLELLDISQDYIYLAEYIYDLKELEKALLKMIEALR